MTVLIGCHAKFQSSQVANWGADLCVRAPAALYYTLMMMLLLPLIEAIKTQVGRQRRPTDSMTSEDVSKARDRCKICRGPSPFSHQYVLVEWARIVWVVTATNGFGNEKNVTQARRCFRINWRLGLNSSLTASWLLRWHNSRWRWNYVGHLFSSRPLSGEKVVEQEIKLKKKKKNKSTAARPIFQQHDRPMMTWLVSVYFDFD